MATTDTIRTRVHHTATTVLTALRVVPLLAPDRGSTDSTDAGTTAEGMVSMAEVGTVTIFAGVNSAAMADGIVSAATRASEAAMASMAEVASSVEVVSKAAGSTVAAAFMAEAGPSTAEAVSTEAAIGN